MKCTSSKFCSRSFRHAELVPNGDIRFCPGRTCHNFIIGNIYETKNFEEVWNSEKAKEFRKSIINGSYSFCDREHCDMRNEHLEDADLASIGYHSDGTLQCYPRYVRFSHDLSCNHRCTMCRPDFIVNSKERNEQLDALIPTHLLPMLKDASDIALNGEGELFASKHCRNFVRKITEKYPDIFFSLHTNGTLCDEKNMQELGILNRLKHVEVSIHAATEKTYRTITRSDHFHRVWKNVEYLAKLKKEGKLKSLELIFVVQALNYIEMKAFLQRAIDLDCIAKFWIAKHYENSASRSELYRDNKMLPPEKRQVAYLFNVSHPEWETFIKMLTDSIFDSKHCLFTQTLAKIRKPSLQYRIKNKIKKIAVKIYNKWKTPY